MHVDSFLWAYTVYTKRLSCVTSVPEGTKSTGFHVVEEPSDWIYVMRNFQQPGDWQNLRAKVKAVNGGTARHIAARRF